MRYFFGNLEFDVAACQVVREDGPRRLTPRLLRLLSLFVESDGRVLSKQELLDSAWGGRFVDEGSLNRAVSTLRTILGDEARHPQLIQTVPRLGYRFVPVVTRGDAQARGIAIVGREAELETLRLLLERADGGEACAALVSGEAGIGKTTLVDEFLNRLSGTPVLVARTSCQERLAGTAAYRPLLALSRALLDRSVFGAEAVHVISGVDEITQWAATDRRAHHERPRVLRALLRWLAEKHTLVLFIDDWQWADASSVELVARLAVQLREHRVFWVFAYRRTRDLAGRGPFRLARYAMQPMSTDIVLEGLSPRGIGALLRVAFGLHGFPPEFAPALFERTGGNPLFLTALLDDLRRSDCLFQEDDGGRWMLRRLDDGNAFPGGLRALIEQRLARLSAPDRILLQAASVQGMEFDASTIGRQCGLDPGTAVDRLARIEEREGFIRAVDIAPGSKGFTRFAFAHILYQRSIFELMHDEHRQRLSRSLASSLTPAASSDARTESEVAFLSREGRDFATSYELFCRAANQAANAGACREAIALANHALDIAPYLSGPDAGNAVRLRLARYHRELRSHDDLERAIVLCHEVLRGDPECAEACLLLANLYTLLSTYSAAPPTDLVPMARVYAERSRIDDGLEYLTTTGLAHLGYDWDPARARRSLERAMELRSGSGVPHQFYSFYRVAAGDADGAVDAAGTAREHEPHSVTFHAHHAWMMYFARRFDQAEAELQSLIDVDPLFWRGHLNLAWVYSARGDTRRALRAFERAAELNRNPTTEAFLAYGYARDGRAGDARRLMERLASGGRYVSPLWLSWCWMALGDTEQMFRHLDLAVDDREFCLILLEAEPAMDEVRSLPRFREIVSRIGLRRDDEPASTPDPRLSRGPSP